MPNDINILKDYKKFLKKIVYDKSNRLDNMKKIFINAYDENGNDLNNYLLKNIFK